MATRKPRLYCANVGSPLSSRTSWGVEAAASHGSVASWFVGGSYATVLADRHALVVAGLVGVRGAPHLRGNQMFGDVSAFCALGLIALTLLGVGVLPLLYLVVLGGREAPVRRVERLLKALAVPVRAWR